MMMSDNYLTHEEMLEIASQREAMNAQKRKIEKQFDAWFEEMEGYSFRYERFWDDFDYAKASKDTQSMVKWLRTAFEMGYYASESKIYGGTE
jgi:hypothetical protein